MAKKQAVPSRQQYHKKKENKFIDMPKDQLIKVCVIAAIVILAIVLFFVLRDKYDGHLEVVDSIPVTESDNWIVANTGNSTAPRYYKIGEIGEIEGYTREYDASGRTQDLTPSDAALGITNAYVMAANGEYDVLADNVRKNLPQYIAGAVVGEADTSDINGHAARNFPYSYSYPETDAETGAETGLTNYSRGQYVYIKAGRGQSVLIHLGGTSTDEAALPAEDTLKNEAAKIANAVSID